MTRSREMAGSISVSDSPPFGWSVGGHVRSLRTGDTMEDGTDEYSLCNLYIRHTLTPCLPVCLPASTYPSFCLSLPVCLPLAARSLYLSLYLSNCLSLPTYLSVCAFTSAGAVICQITLFFVLLAWPFPFLKLKSPAPSIFLICILYIMYICILYICILYNVYMYTVCIYFCNLPAQWIIRPSIIVDIIRGGRLPAGGELKLCGDKGGGGSVSCECYAA